MKKYLSFIIFWGISLSLSLHARAESILDFNTVIQVQESGVISVKENILYDFGYEQRHGIFRSIPYDKTNEDGDKFLMKIDNIIVSDGQGNNYNFTTTDNKSAKEKQIKIGDADRTITGIHNYVIEYRVSGAITYFLEHDELNWNLTGTDWTVPMANAQGEIILPENMPTTELKSVCYTGAYNSNASDCTTHIIDNRIFFQGMGALAPYENITAVVGFPKGFVQILEPTKDHSDLWSIILGLAILSGIFFWYVVTPLLVFFKRSGYRRYMTKNQRVVAAWFEPPYDDNLNRDYTPAEIGVLIDKVPDNKEITATIIHLAQKGYLKIKAEGKKVQFIRQKDYENDNKLEKYEKLLLEGIFSSGTEVSLDTLSSSTSFGNKILKFYPEVEKALEDKNLFEKKFTSEKAKKLVLDVLSAVSINIPLMIVLFVYRKDYLKFNSLGLDKYSKTVSLFNFLKSQDAQLDFQAEKQMFFEKLLPYATAFGVEDIWARRFKDMKLAPTDWYEGDLNRLTTGSLLSSTISRSVTSSISSVTATRSSSGFSSGFSGGGGGFSGGGGGGGGGGSW